MSFRRLALGVLLSAVVLTLGAGPAAGSHAPDLFFSEYIEGSSNNKALEIFNGTGSPVDLAAGAYNVQIFFNGSTSAGLTINLTGTVVPGDVFVLAQSSANATVLAQADQTNGAGWFNGDDAVVLRKGTGVLDVIGQVGFDPGAEWGTALTSTADNTLRRKPSVFVGDANSGDAFDPAAQWDGLAQDTFDGLGAHTIEEDEDFAPFVASSDPANGAANVALDADVTITFSEPVDATGAWYAIECADSGAHTAAVSGGPTSFTLDPDADFVNSEDCTVTITAASVTDQDADDPPDAMAGDHAFTFTTAAPPLRIREVQGAGHVSPYVNMAVSGVEGIVTGRRGGSQGGLWIQDPAPDASDLTSEGIFVRFGGFPPSAFAVGTRISVAGTVREFRGGADQLAVTRIEGPVATLVSTGNPLPGPVVLGPDGRMPPTETIDDDSDGDVETSPTHVFDPANDGIDFYEALEGMRVQANPGTVVMPTRSFGEIVFLPDDFDATGIRTPRGGILYSYADPNPERITVDDEIVFGRMPQADVGDRVTAPVIGPIDYSFDNYKIQAASVPTVERLGLQREVATAPRDQELAVATFNVENLSVGNPDEKFAELAGMIVDNLRSPDLIGIEEVQDDSGSANDGTVDATQTWNKLIAAITAAGGPLYQFRQINPVNNEDGGAPGANIRVGFLFRTDRGLEFVDRPGGDATTPTAVVAHPSGPRLTLSPGRIDPNHPSYFETRKSLAGEFRFRGKKVIAVVVHFSSKGDDEPLFGRFQPPTRHSEVARHGQAQVVADFVAEVHAADPNAYVVVIGDVNDFEFSETVDILEGGGLTTFMDTLPPNERYSYVFEGNSQTLDQILGSDRILGRLVEYDVVHVNAEFADQASDHDPSVARINMIGPR